METRSHKFHAFGVDEQDAMRSLRRGWNEHEGHKSQGDILTFDSVIRIYGVTITRINPGLCLMDNDFLTDNTINKPKLR